MIAVEKHYLPLVLMDLNIVLKDREAETCELKYKGEEMCFLKHISAF